MIGEKAEFECSNCCCRVKSGDDFCPDCGTLFTKGIKCINHQEAGAGGVCVICCEPFCEVCGLIVNNFYFVCEKHSGYEIIECMTRVFGSFDDTQAQYIKTCLEQDGLHPMLFNRNQPSKSGRFINNIIDAGGDFLIQTENETKIMVPCQEVLKAEKILEELKSSYNSSPE